MGTAGDTRWIPERAKSLGFALCGVARAERFPEHERLAEWLGRGYGGEMHYLEDARRSDPARVLAGAKSVIVCAMSYNTDRPYSAEVRANPETDGPRGWISRYAWGQDYHEVLGEKLQELTAALAEQFPGPFEARCYVDTGPIPERVFAKHAGLGWLGKNTLLINEELGSWLFLGVILTTLDLIPSLKDTELPPADLCGNCRMCLDACPNGALVEPYVLDARRCISYLTIELRGSIPEELREPMGQHVFGCDICQEVCPWNRQAPLADSSSFQPRMLLPDTTNASREEILFHPHLEELASLTQEEFRSAFQGSPIRRTKWRGLVRNACLALGNLGGRADPAARRRIRSVLTSLLTSEDQVIGESAHWALSRIESSERGAPVPREL